jgi:hypothetical protein
MRVSGPDGHKRVEPEAEEPARTEDPPQGQEAAPQGRKTRASDADPSGLGWRAKLIAPRSNETDSTEAPRETGKGVASAIADAVNGGEMTKVDKSAMPEAAQACFAAKEREDRGPQAFKARIDGKDYYIISDAGKPGYEVEKPHTQSSDDAVDDDTLEYTAFDEGGNRVASGTYD